MLTDNNAPRDCQANETALTEAFSRLNFLPSRRLVYDHIKNTATEQAPLVKDMCVSIGLSDRNIYACMRELERYGFIRRERIGKYNRYFICERKDWKV